MLVDILDKRNIEGFAPGKPEHGGCWHWQQTLAGN